MTIKSATSPLFPLVALGALVSAALGACSSDEATPGVVADAGAEGSVGAEGGVPSDAGSSDSSAGDAASDAATDAATEAAADAATDGGSEASTDAGPCSPKGESDVKVLNANSGTDPSGKVTVKMVDDCQGTTAAQSWAGTRLAFTPANGTNHYFLVEPVNAADFYKSASVVYNFPIAGVRTDTDIKIFAKPGIGGATDSFGANYDATKAHFVVQLNKLEATCDVSGFTVSVVGHSEAVVQYSNGGSFAPVPSQTTSAGSQGGFAFISKVNPGAGLVQIVGTKTGCKLVGPVFPVAISANTYPLVADTVTYLVANTSL